MLIDIYTYVNWVSVGLRNALPPVWYQVVTDADLFYLSNVNKLQWNMIKKHDISFHENELENIVCKMSVILLMLQFVDDMMQRKCEKRN